MRKPIHRPIANPTPKPIHAIIFSAVLTSIVLSGCQTTAQKVYINVPTPCIESSQLPAAPSVKTDAELLAMTDADLVLNLAADRLEFRRFHGEASALLLACVR